MPTLYTPQMSKPARLLASLALVATLLPAQVPEKQATLLVGGDVQWSLTLRPPTVLFTTPDPNDPDWRASPYLNQGDSKAAFEALQPITPKPESKHKSID
jgi:hypothetical protein